MSEGWVFQSLGHNFFFFFLNGKRKEKQADLTDLRELGTFTTGKLCSCML